MPAFPGGDESMQRLSCSSDSYIRATCAWQCITGREIAEEKQLYRVLFPTITSKYGAVRLMERSHGGPTKIPGYPSAQQPQSVP